MNNEILWKKIADSRDGYLTKKTETPSIFQLEYFSVCRDLWIDLILPGRGGTNITGIWNRKYNRNICYLCIHYCDTSNLGPSRKKIFLFDVAAFYWIIAVDVKLLFVLLNWFLQVFFSFPWAMCILYSLTHLQLHPVL